MKHENLNFSSLFQVRSLQEAYHGISEISQKSFFAVKVDGESISVVPLKEFGAHVGNETKIYLAFADPCTLPEYPGWPLRNLLTLITYHW